VLGQSAERVLHGELPQRDFDDVYTGGLSMLHAAAFRALGVRLHSLRLVLLAASVVFAWGLFRLATRFAPPPAAAALSALGVAWSVPNYFASMPSWYDLFLATFGALALARHVETGRARWLAAAGALAGASVLVKLHGAFLVAACLLYAVDRERRTLDAPSSSRRSPAYLAVVAAALGAFVAALAVLVARRGGGASESLHFVAPSAAIAAYLLASEWRAGRGPLGGRLRRLTRLEVPILLGVAAPLAAFAFPYALTGSVRQLVTGVLSAGSRITTASLGVPLPPWDTLAPGLFYGVTLFVPAAAWTRGRRLAAGVVGAALAVCAFAFSGRGWVYRQVFESARSLAPVAVIAGAAALWRRGDAAARDRRDASFAVLAMAAMVLMVQFPFSAPIYFCFAAPLVAVAVRAVVDVPEPRRKERRAPQESSHRPRLLDAGVLAFYLVFAVWLANPVYVYQFGRSAQPYRADASLDPARAGLRVPAADAETYADLVATVRRESPGGRMLAGPDCPEVYFLADLRNAARSLVDFPGPPREAPESVLRELAARGDEVVVVNNRPDFSPHVSPEMLEALRGAYPRSRDIGRFTVFWKGPEVARP